jgi:dihydropteroate synthase
VIATPLDVRSGRAARDVLVRHGWDPARAADAAAGLTQALVHIEGLDAGAIEALVPFAGRLGIELLTGENWVLLAGSTSRLAALARPWTVPPVLAATATAVGTALLVAPPEAWMVRGRILTLDQPLLMGVLNVTPDSFSDGGLHVAPGDAVAHAERLIEAGARIIDVGGESTRPGRTAPVAAGEERRRVLPVVSELARRFPDVVISVDTMKSDVARPALDAGAHVVNDVTGLRHDPAIADTVAEAGAGLVLMHSRGEVLEIASYAHADYDDPVAEVRLELSASLAVALARGVPREHVALDPGFGFSKRPEQNILLADQLAGVTALGQPVVVGPSRKRFLGVVTGAGPDRRDAVTAACCALCYERGARVFRVHDVAMTREALSLARAFGGSLPDA